MRALGYLMAAALVLSGCGPPLSESERMPQETAAPVATATESGAGAAAAWLEANAISFDTVEPSSGFKDLMPLKKIIGHARIVSLGEATHGTHEFFQMKNRMLEFLVEQMGFTTFAMEANWPEAERVNVYIHTGQGNPAELLKGMHFWTWDTQEVLAMVQWMRTYNENPGHARKLDFFGFDMQFDEMARQNVILYMEQVDPVSAQRLSDDFSCFPKTSLECQRKLRAVYDWLSQREANYTAKSSPEAFDQALHSARLVLQYDDYASHGNDYFLRDRYMAENVTWLLDRAGPDAKAVLWAHNGHVGMSNGVSLQTMGDHLRRQFGTQMVVFGLLFYRGAFHAYGKNGIEAFRVDLPPDNSYEAYLHMAEMPLFCLDLRPVTPGSPAADWLVEPHVFRFIGSAYDPNHPEQGFFTAPLAKMFDAVIYIEDTSPSLLLEQ